VNSVCHVINLQPKLDLFYSIPANDPQIDEINSDGEQKEAIPKVRNSLFNYF